MGLPLTTGFAAKFALKDAAFVMAEPWALSLISALTLSGLMTTLLVARFLFLVWSSRQQSHGKLRPAMAVPWGLLTIGVVFLFVAMPATDLADPKWFSLAPYKLWAAAWPMLVALLIVLVVATAGPLRRKLCAIHIPSGDVVIPLTYALELCLQFWRLFVDIETSVLNSKINEMIARFSSNYQQLVKRCARPIENDTTGGFMIGILAAAPLALTILAW